MNEMLDMKNIEQDGLVKGQRGSLAKKLNEIERQRNMEDAQWQQINNIGDKKKKGSLISSMFNQGAVNG